MANHQKPAYINGIPARKVFLDLEVIAHIEARRRSMESVNGYLRRALALPQASYVTDVFTGPLKGQGSLAADALEFVHDEEARVRGLAVDAARAWRRPLRADLSAKVPAGVHAGEGYFGARVAGGRGVSGSVVPEPPEGLEEMQSSGGAEDEGGSEEGYGASGEGDGGFVPERPLRGEDVAVAGGISPEAARRRATRRR